MTLTREADTETIATLRAQLDSTLKDRALIMAERDTAKKIADAMEGEAHAHIKLWGDALRRAAAAEAKLAERDALARVRAEFREMNAREHSVRAVEWVDHIDDDGNPVLRHRIEQVIDGAWKPIPCVGPTSVSAAQADHDARIRAAIGGAE